MGDSRLNRRGLIKRGAGGAAAAAVASGGVIPPAQGPCGLTSSSVPIAQPAARRRSARPSSPRVPDLFCISDRGGIDQAASGRGHDPALVIGYLRPERIRGLRSRTAYLQPLVRWVGDAAPVQLPARRRELREPLPPLLAIPFRARGGTDRVHRAGDRAPGRRSGHRPAETVPLGPCSQRQPHGEADGRRAVALTEYPPPVVFDPKSLKTPGVDKSFGGKLHLTTSHPQLDRHRGARRLPGPGAAQRLCHPLLPKRRMAQAGEVPVDRIAYLHSFALTERYAVIVEGRSC